MFEKMIEHNEIDTKNLTNSDQSYLIVKDNAFRKHYFECFNHEPIECIWPEITSEYIEEPDIFVRINIMKTLITKKTVWEANLSVEENRDLDSHGRIRRSRARKNKFDRLFRMALEKKNNQLVNETIKDSNSNTHVSHFLLFN